ncbi:DUF1127 domain-containing protein [Nitratireductor indicus]|uniref:DUF1127 domain-containing protein n=1 Tax=Nitratireductor indicus TaxID=721133 RepID=UPI002875A653|nr:DUF1127 domain-containing protein [Nitratireductor indicus]MDS1135104.1 DUF1127 domain-containing protein [Nitratireductor indicus]
MGTNDTIKGLSSPAARHGAILRTIWQGVEALVSRVSAIMIKRRSRLHLLDLTEEQLRDIGVNRREARLEGHRPFWD